MGAGGDGEEGSERKAKGEGCVAQMEAGVGKKERNQMQGNWKMLLEELEAECKVRRIANALCHLFFGSEIAVCKAAQILAGSTFRLSWFRGSFSSSM